MLPLIPTLMLVLIIAGLVWQRRMNRRVDRMEAEIARLQARIGALKPGDVEAADTQASLDGDTAAGPPEVLAVPEPAAMAGISAAEGPAVSQGPAVDLAGANAVASETIEPQSTADAAKPPRESFESWLGARWAVWVGGLALALGGIFLVRYSIESGLLGPAARLTLAALFGVLLAGAGEIVRRRAMPQLSDRFGNAMIPGALTAAGAVTLMGAVFAAYAVYGFVGPTVAFLTLALISFATIALSLLHGQALAGLGLLASLATPALVSSDNPSANALFGFLTLSWLAVNAASRIRQWTVVPTLANIGLGLWALATIGLAADEPNIVPTAAALIVMIAGTALLWPGRFAGRIGPRKPGLHALLRRPPLAIGLSVSLMSLLPALSMLLVDPADGIEPVIGFACVIATLGALGALRAHAVWPAVIAGFGAVAGMTLTAAGRLDTLPDLVGGAAGLTSPGMPAGEIAVFLLLGLSFAALAFVFLARFRRSEPAFSGIWTVLASAVPVTIAAIAFVNFGNLQRDWTYGLYGIVLGLVLLGGAEWLFRTMAGAPDDEAHREGEADSIDGPANLLVAGSFAGLAFALHALTNGIVTTILIAVLGFLYVLAMRAKPWPALPWMMAAAILIVFGRIAWEPSLIGRNSLGTTPFFNALLPGYGLPTALAIATAWMLRNSPELRIRNIMQALASLAALMTIAVLVRHAMNGGRLDAAVPTLGEQSIYTLVTVGFSGVLMMLDLKSPSPVFRYGSMILGVIATINVLSAHVFALNPYLTGEMTGPWPVLNLLLLGYLLPALAYALVAFLARDRRPTPYVAMLASAGGLLGFLWATLSVRRFWQGENIADWKGFLAAETYSYSVVWLVIGVVLLALGSRFDQRGLRLASAGLVLVAVLKVFLIDMSNLEGILRALSFMGLGGVLIGIGLFYQRILVRKDGGGRPVGAADPSDTPVNRPAEGTDR